jgi:hypothetical protein
VPLSTNIYILPCCAPAHLVVLHVRAVAQRECAALPAAAVHLLVTCARGEWWRRHGKRRRGGRRRRGHVGGKCETWDNMISEHVHSENYSQYTCMQSASAFAERRVSNKLVHVFLGDNWRFLGSMHVQDSVHSPAANDSMFTT